MASAGGATAAFNHMEQELTDKMREIPFTHNTDNEQSAPRSSSSSHSRAVDDEDLEQDVYRDNQSSNLLHSQIGIKNTEAEGSGLTKKVDRLIPMIECAHDLNMILTQDIKGKGTQDLSVLRGHCIHLLETQATKTAVDRALLRFLNGHDAFNSLQGLQELVSKEMQKTEENRVTQGQQHRVSTPEMLYASQYGDQRELILGRRSFNESIPRREENEVGSENDLETASITSGSDASGDSTLLSEQNAKRQQFYSSVKASESCEAIIQASNSRKKVIE